MRMLCPNLDREDGLETVLEIPIPEEMCSPDDRSRRSRQNGEEEKKTAAMVPAWMKMGARAADQKPCVPTPLFGGRSAELQLLLGVAGAPLAPVPIPSGHSPGLRIQDHPLESSMARYIVQQYVAAVGGEKALSSIDSFYAMGEVKMSATEFCRGDAKKDRQIRGGGAAGGGGNGHGGGFVLWQKRPDVWSLELVVSGSKISAGSDGKVAWRRTPWQQSHACGGPPRPLRRSLQGLDPRSTASLFSNAVCMGEKTIKDEDCFLLKLEAAPSTLQARSSNNVEILQHTVWGCFSQKTGLLAQLEDTHLLRISSSGGENIYWETTMESSIHDYRLIDGVSIAHSGLTFISLFRFGDGSNAHTRTRMEEAWKIEEVDFNIRGLSMDCFLPPGDLKKEGEEVQDVAGARIKHPPSVPRIALRVAPSKVVAVNTDDADAMCNG